MCLVEVSKFLKSVFVVVKHEVSEELDVLYHELGRGGQRCRCAGVALLRNRRGGPSSNRGNGLLPCFLVCMRITELELVFGNLRFNGDTAGVTLIDVILIDIIIVHVDVMIRSFGS